MDLEVSDIIRGIGVLVRGLGTAIYWLSFGASSVLKGGYQLLSGTVKTLSWPIFALLSWVVSILITPFIVPWSIAVWWWEKMVYIYEELEPMIPYVTFCCLLAAMAGVLVVVLTHVLLTLLHYYIPWLAPAEPGQTTRRRTSSSSPLYATSRRRRRLTHHLIGEELLGEDISLSSGSESDEELELGEEEEDELDTLSKGVVYSSAVKKSPRHRAPPAGVRVAATIHEESSG